MGQIAVLMDYKSVIVALTPVLVDYREAMVGFRAVLRVFRFVAVV